MLFYTLQGYDLTSFSGPICLDKGTYRDQPVIKESQKKLYEIVGTNQVIWLSQDRPYLGASAVCFLHRIEARKEDIVAFIDGFVWNHIIGNSQYIPEDEHRKLRHALVHKSGTEYDMALRESEDNYLRLNIPTDLWGSEIDPDA
ncbi:MAG: hypothetical protein O3B01_28775 [Planctomycetota bacterium]|nr:hypothetical protein [Planctomycetota bacterium]